VLILEEVLGELAWTKKGIDLMLAFIDYECSLYLTTDVIYPDV